MINLDQRKDRWEKMERELLPYGIVPERFPGIYGWLLPPSVLNDIGLKFKEGMWSGKGQRHVLHFPEELNGAPQYVILGPHFFGKTCFFGSAKGPIGCTLSHLSVLNDAYQSGYETIWVLEDDICVRKNPHVLSDLIDELDGLASDWDMLYTSNDRLIINPNDPIDIQIPFLWRPDMPFFDLETFAEYEEVGDQFLKIHSRHCTNSILYRRSGIKKILDFYRAHQIFLPIDVELSFVPDLQMYILKETVVNYLPTVTPDTDVGHQSFFNL